MARTVFWISTLCCAIAVGLASFASTPPNLAETLAAQEAKVVENPGDATALNDLGNLLVLADRLGDAENAYRRALDVAPNELRTRFNLGVLLQQTGRIKEAESAYAEVLEAEPRYAWAHYQLGVLLAERRQRDQAVEHYARALALDPALSFAENNPHILDNKLFSEALLVSQRYRPEVGSRVPRQYAEPDRIIRLMLESRSLDEGEPEAEGASGTSSGGGGSGASGAASGGVPGTGGLPANANLGTAQTERPAAQGTPPRSNQGSTVGRSTGGVQVGSPSTSTPRAAAPPRSAPPSRTAPAPAPPPRVVGPRSSTGSGSGTSTVRPGAAPRSAPPSTSSPPPRERPRYVPSRRSSAQLELRWEPAPEQEARG